MGSMDPRQQTLFFIFSGLFGLVVGSFLNVCIFRVPRNCMSIVAPRSRCPKCLNWIAWYDNFPVLSWCILGGKCRHCRNPISVRYTLVELLTGGLFLIAGWRALYGVAHPGWPQAVGFAVEAWLVSALIVCTFIDLEFRILPDEITLSGAAIGLVASAVFPFLHGGTGLEAVPGDIVRPFPWYPGHGLPWDLREPHLASLAASAAGALAGGGSI